MARPWSGSWDLHPSRGGATFHVRYEILSPSQPPFKHFLYPSDPLDLDSFLPSPSDMPAPPSPSSTSHTYSHAWWAWLRRHDLLGLSRRNAATPDQLAHVRVRGVPEGHTLSIITCPVTDHFNGSYTVCCGRPPVYWNQVCVWSYMERKGGGYGENVYVPSPT